MQYELIDVELPLQWECVQCAESKCNGVNHYYVRR